MAVVKLEQVSKKARDLYNRASTAVERGNEDYAIDMLLATLVLEPEFLQARRMLRAAEIKKTMSGKSSMTGLKGMSAKSKVKAKLKKDPAEALKIAEEQLMTVDPLNSGFIYLYIEAALAADMPEAAVMTMELARDYNRNDKDYIEQLGDLYLATGDPKHAVECFTAVSDMEPNDQQIRKKIRDAAAVNTISTAKWEADSDFTEKLAHSEEAAQLEKENKAVLSTEDITGMIHTFLLRAEHEPENVSHARRLGDLYSQAGEFDTAIDWFEKANSLTKGGDPEIERSIITTTLKIYDHNITYYQEEGMAAEAEQALKDRTEYEFQIAAERVQNYPNDREFKFLYGELLFGRGEYTEAIRQFQEGKKNPKYRLEAQYYLGRCFHRKGQLDMATAALEEAVSEMLIMDETKKNVLYELGSIAEDMSDYDKALLYYKEIYQVDIGFKDIDKKIEEGYRRQQQGDDAGDAPDPGDS